MPKKTIAWQFRWPAPIHERAVRIADANERSLNAQVMYWLKNGGMPADLLDELKADMAEAAVVAGAQP
jgi:5,10-methenyltetrahydromethanopterin hydrogenase